MQYKFHEMINIENNRTFIKIPFNIWEETGLKGNIPCKVSILDLFFECKLLPKGNGNYWIPITKKIASSLEIEKEYEIEIEMIASLSRINHDSPYSKEHPIRKIDHIDNIPIQAGYCGHGCVAMLAGVPLSQVIEQMGKSHASWSKILEALDYYGISYAPKAVYTKGNTYPLPPCCIVYNDNGFILWYKDSFYGTTTPIDPSKTTSYIEIFVD